MTDRKLERPRPWLPRAARGAPSRLAANFTAWTDAIQGCLRAAGSRLPNDVDVAALATRAFATAFKIGLQLSAPFLVFGLVFNIGLGVLARLMPAMQVYFVGVPLSIMAGFLILALVLTGMMATYLNYFIGVMHELTPLK